jgi:RNA polymerase sigma-70 factor (ECF subfamily)
MPLAAHPQHLVCDGFDYRQVFVTIYQQLVRLSPQLLAFARAVCGNPEAADDLVQDAIERALKAASPPVELPDVAAWMFRIIRNLHIDDLRRGRVRAEYAADQERLSGEGHHRESDPLQDLLVRQAFEALSPPHREVIFLVDIMGMRYLEAGNVLGVAEGTIMSRLSRARRAMIEHLEDSNVSPLQRRRRN